MSSDSPNKPDLYTFGHLLTVSRHAIVAEIGLVLIGVGGWLIHPSIGFLSVGGALWLDCLLSDYYRNRAP